MNLKELITQLNDALIDASLAEIEAVDKELSELEHTIVERQMDCNDSATVRLTRSTLRSTSSFFSSSAMLRLRNIAIETTHANNSREPRARAPCKHSATVHPARLRAPTPHRIHRIEFQYSHTKSMPQPSRARPAFPGERSKYALDIRRNTSRGRNCGRFLLRHDF